jgi:hypothetical protein
MKLNDPDIVAEVTAAFEVYERALMDNDTGVLNELFWEDSRTIRYGIGVNGYGHREIAAERARRAADPRTLQRTVITTYGDDFATANTEFTRAASGRRGRQSQTWVRLPAGWRVVAAHVSWLTDGA